MCLEDEIADPGDWRATVVGQMPVVVARDGDGEIAAFENRCAHRGALICLDNAGRLGSWPDFFVESCFYKITSADNRKHGDSGGIV